MTDLAREPYRRWRVFVFVVVIVVASLAVGGLVAAVAVLLSSTDSGALAGIAAGTTAPPRR